LDIQVYGMRIPCEFWTTVPHHLKELKMRMDGQTTSAEVTTAVQLYTASRNPNPLLLWYING
jgi:hypothetical protein